MKTYIYRGGFPIVEKSGVGKAIEHQEKMLNAVEAPRAARWKEATVVHMNTVFPDSVIAAFIAKMQKKNIAVEVLNRALKEYVNQIGRQNVVMMEKFSTKFQKIAATYNERTSVEDIQKIIEELINLKNEIEEELKAGNEFNLSSEEKAFFDALGDDPEVKELMKDEILVQIAKELVETVNSNMTIDWDIRKDARAKMRIEIKKLLIKYNYPPNKSEKAVQTVIRQAELKCKEMIE